MRVAVTGGAGFIGRHTVAELEKRGHTVDVIDREHGFNIVDGDLHEAFSHADTIVHLAGVLGTGELVEDAVQLAIDVNITGTRRVLDAAVERGASYVGITMPDCWPSVYQATKLSAVRLAHAYNNRFKLPVTHIRAFNAYGPDQAVGPGHPQKIVPTFAQRSWRGEPIPIWGEGDQTVDLVHVDHIARCLATAVELQVDGIAGDCETWDAGTGEELTVVQVAQLVGRVTGNSLVEFLPMRAGETPHTYLAALDFGPLPSDELDFKLFIEAINAYR